MIAFKINTIVESREHPYVSKTNSISFNADILTISFL